MENSEEAGWYDLNDETSPKPYSTTEAQAYCATSIANLEGWRGGTLPGTVEGRQLCLGQLETRVRRLENLDGIHPPPPMDLPSWDALAYRVARLHRNMPPGATSKLATTPPPLVEPTMDSLRSTVRAIGGVGPQSWTVFTRHEGDLQCDDDLLQAAAQFLCYLAGKRSYRVVGSFDLKPILALALDLSLDADANSGFYVGTAFYHDGLRRRTAAAAAATTTTTTTTPTPTPTPTPTLTLTPPPATVPASVPASEPALRTEPDAQRICCGCCACSCHDEIRNRPTRTVETEWSRRWRRRRWSWRSRPGCCPEKAPTRRLVVTTRAIGKLRRLAASCCCGLFSPGVRDGQTSPADGGMSDFSSIYEP